MNNKITEVEAMITAIEKRLAEINSKPINEKQKSLEARELMENEWHMIVQEVRHKENGKAALIIYPSYMNSKYILIFLDQAYSHMEAFLRQQMKIKAIKFTCELKSRFTNEKTNMENNQTVTIGEFEYADMVELSTSLNHELHDLFIRHITQYCKANKGYKFREVQCFTINIL